MSLVGLPTWRQPGSMEPPGPRPKLRFTENSYDNCMELDRSLSESDPDVFQKSLQLVEVIGEAKPGFIAEGSPVLRPLNKHSLSTHIVRHMDCEKQVSGSWVSCVPPSESALLPMIHFGRWRKIRPIIGVVEAPIFRPDGTIAQEPGYDDATGYLYRPTGEFPGVPENPTQEDARLAFISLRQVFCDFPYVTEPMRDVPIAALLTILARAAIDGNVPVFAFEASIQGSGKTLQGDAVHIIATGRMGAHGPFPHDPEEQRKAIFSCARSGAPVAFFDNVKGQFGGEAIENAITSGEIKQRVLGASDDITVPWILTTIVTGNNMTMTEDMLRRSLMCRIEPKEEDPTDRNNFAHPDLLDWVRAERPRLLVAALTILRAYACKGFPDAGLGVMQSFNAWSRLVPSAIYFAGGENVLKAKGSRDNGGTDEAGAFAMFASDLPRLSDQPITAKNILGALYPAPKDGEPPDGWDTMREAIEILCPTRSPFAPDAARFGMLIKSRVGQVSKGMKFCSRKNNSGIRVYWMDPVQ